MRIIGRKAICEFVRKHPDAAASLDNWYRITSSTAPFGSFPEVGQDPRSADMIRLRIVFEIHGNDYRLIGRVNYKWQRFYILNVMTPAEYVRKGV